MPELPLIERSAADAFGDLPMDGLDLDAVTPVEGFARLQAQGTVWVAEDAGRLAGFGACEAFPDALHLWELDVRLELQGRGIGRALVVAIADGARQRRLPAVTLTTFRSIRWNAPYYARLGFRLLEPAALNPRLQDVLAHEAERGLTDRCAMRLDI